LFRFQKWKNNIVQSKYLYLMFIIPIIYFLLFHYTPMFGLIIAFKNYNFVEGIFGSEWVGFEHFKSFIFDPYFWKLVRNTVVLNVYMLIFFFPAPIILALLLNEVRHEIFKKVVQTISYLPYFLSTVVVSGMIVTFLASDGLINQVVTYFRGAPIQFLMKPEWFRTIYVSSEIWQGLGWGAIIYLAALTSID